MNSDPAQLSIRDQVRAMRRGDLTPTALVKRHLELIDKHNSKLNALVTVDRAAALALAKTRTQEARRGQFRGRLHGVVFSVRESIDVAGLPRSDGTSQSLVPSAARNAAAVERLLNEGAICIGKGNIAEHGKAYITDNPLYGLTSHPLDPALTPGGSGGGDAAAVAMGFASFALGADAGGSIRVPANFCGLYGAFATPGIISQGRLTHLSQTTSRLFRGLGPLARTRDDLEILLSVLTGFDPEDAGSLAVPANLSNEFEHRSCIVYSALNGVRVDPEIERALDRCASQCERAGLRVRRDPPPVLEQCYEPFIVLAGPTALLTEDLLSRLAGTPRDPASEGSIMKSLRHRIATELPPLTTEMIVQMWYRLDMLRHEAAQLFRQHDFLIGPVAATLPCAHGTSTYLVSNQRLQSQQAFQFASAINALGIPAIAFPAGASARGLPIGLQAIGPRFSEGKLLRLLRTLIPD